MNLIETIEARITARDIIIMWSDERTGDDEFEARITEFARPIGNIVEDEDGDLRLEAHPVTF